MFKKTKLQMAWTKEYSDVEFIIPPLSCCTDNAAMIAVAGTIAYQHGVRADYSLTADPGIDLEES